MAEDRRNELFNARASLGRGNHMRTHFDLWQRVGHGNRITARLQQNDIVFGVADPGYLCEGQGQFRKDRRKPGGLVDPLGQDHQSIGVEDDVGFKVHLFNRAPDGFVVPQMGCHDGLPDWKLVYATGLQSSDKII